MSLKINEIFTSGVYSKTEDEFFQMLSENNIDILIDVRNRRGMRGATYAYANSNRLQQRLSVLGILYYHAKYISPTENIRILQKQDDLTSGTKKRQRTVMSDAFKNAYSKSILTDEALNHLMSEISGIAEENQLKSVNVCLLCVESLPTACHRKLLAEALSVKVKASIIHI